MPTNLYGPGDNYHPENSHVLPALIRRMHAAKVAKDASVTIWGSGRPLREFLHADDAAAGIVHLLQIKNPPDWVNLGTGSEISIRELAELIQKCVGFEGQLKFDTQQPDGTPRKLTCNQLMASTGWHSKINLESGVKAAYASYLQELEAGALRE
jgi:GDP-L-fucose synthase